MVPHQGSALNPFLRNVAFDVLIEAVSEGPPWDMMDADDVVFKEEIGAGEQGRKNEAEERVNI